MLQSYRIVQTVRKRKRAIKSQKEESLIWEHSLPLYTLDCVECGIALCLLTVVICVDIALLFGIAGYVVLYALLFEKLLLLPL